MSNVLIRGCCVVLLAGATLSVGIGVKRATAQTQINTPYINALINACIQKAQTQGLTSQEEEYCQSLVELRQRLGDYIYEQHRNVFEQFEKIRTAPLPPATDFGIGNQ